MVERPTPERRNQGDNAGDDGKRRPSTADGRSNRSPERRVRSVRGGNTVSGWTFLSNHGHVLVCIAANPDARLRDIAEAVGITERAVFGIVRDLEQAGYVERAREGRRNHYLVHTGQPLRHPLEGGHVIGDLLEAIGDGEATSSGPAGHSGPTTHHDPPTFRHGSPTVSDQAEASPTSRGADGSATDDPTGGPATSDDSRGAPPSGPGD